jgi:hypothetical protein
MPDNPYLTRPHSELIALQRMCQASRFGQTTDPEIALSLTCGKIYTQVIAALLASEYASSGVSGVQKWLDWLKVDPTRDEWKFAVTLLRADDRFEHWSEYTKHQHVQLVMQPFELTTEQVQAMIAAVEDETKR